MPSTAVTRTARRAAGIGTCSENERPRSGASATTWPPTWTIDPPRPGGAVPATRPNETSRGAGATIAGGGRAGASIMLASWPSLGAAILAPSRPRRVLRRRRGARAAGAAPKAARRRRRPARPRRRLDGELRRPTVRDPLGDELRRGAAPLPGGGLRAPAPLALPRVLAGRLGGRARGRAARRAHRARRGLPRPRPGSRADYSRARAVAEAVQTSVRAATSLSCSLGVAPTKVVAKVASDRRKPGGITVVPAGTEAALPGAVRRPGAAGRRAARGGAARRRRRDDDRRARGALRPRPARAAAGPGRPDAPRPRERHRPARPRDSSRADLDLGRGDLRARPRTTASSCTPSCGGWPSGSARTSAATASRPAR